MNQDYLDLLRCLADRKVRYLIIGGYAVIRYTEPRYTKDLDIWIDATPLNARRVLQALREFGAPIDNLSVEDLAKPGLLYVFGIPPVRVDILNKVKGAKFSTAWPNKVRVKLPDLSLNFVDISTLKRLKRAAARPQDLADLEKLNAVMKKAK